MNDSRKDDRLNVALIMRYREPTMLEPREGQCQNLSLSGMCIATPKPSPRGALIRFECISGGAADGIRGTARVVWQRSKGDQRGGAPSMGVRFVRLEPGCREALEALIDQLGGERKPSGSGLPRAPDGSDAPASDRPGQATLIISPATGSGMTQQGMGAARKRSAHYPTLRGIGLPSSVPPRGKRKSSRAPALDVTLPGHATTSSTPFPATPSAPPEPPSAGQDAMSDTLRDRLDRTHRGMGPTSSPAESDQDTASSSGPAAPYSERDAEGAGPSESARAPDETHGDRAPQRGEVHDLRGGPARSDPAHQRSGRDVEDATVEPVDDEFAARRRAARAAAFSAAPLELPDPDSARRRNWLPWVVIGGGLLVSLLMIRAFGSPPAGVPVSSTVEDAEKPSPSSAPAEPTAGAPAAQPTATAPLAQAQPGTLRTGSYMLEVVSEPSGARISAADQVVLAPAVLELAAVTGPIEVKAELEGHEAAATTIEPTAFQLQDGRQVAKVVIKLTPSSSSSSKRAGDGKDEASAPRERAARTSAPPRRPRTRSADEQAPSAPPATPQIATPPVPIESQPAATEAPASTAAASSPAASEPAAPASASAPNGPSALETALECLSRGDNLCVITTLEGKARSARELEVLIETHLALGNSADAERSMRRYLDRFPDGKSAPKYQRWLERRGAPEP